MSQSSIVFVGTAILWATTLQGFSQASPTNAAPPTAATEIVARVGSAAIHRRELDMAMIGVLAQIQRQGRTVSAEQRQRLEYDVLNSLIDREVVLQSAQPQPPADLDGKVKEQWKQACAAAGGEDILLKALQEAGISREEFEQRTRENVLVGETLRQIVKTQTHISSEEVKAFYEANRARMKQPEMVRASHILVRVHPEATDDIKKACRTKINAARSLILAGEKFADIARKVSDDPETSRNGGDLGFFPRGVIERTFGPELEKAAFSLPTNRVSEVISSPLGFHLLMVTDRRPEKTLTFEEAKPEIERILRAQKSNERIREYTKQLRQKTKIEILLPAPSPAATNAPVAPRL